MRPIVLIGLSMVLTGLAQIVSGGEIAKVAFQPRFIWTLGFWLSGMCLGAAAMKALGR